jgi:hypothetical protein
VRDAEDPSLGYVCQPPEIVVTGALTTRERDPAASAITGPMDGR